MLNNITGAKDIKFVISAGWKTQKTQPHDVHLKTKKDYSLSAD